MANEHTKKESRLTATSLIRLTGLSAIMAGILYIAIQMVHPADELSSVDTNSWLIVACMTIAMSVLSLIGITGIFTRQVKETGWLGLIGYLIFSLFWLTSTAFSFAEAFVIPMLADEAPEYVKGFVGIFGNDVSEVDLGFLPVLAPIAGVLYTLGGLLLGIATFRAKVLPRPAAVLLALGAVVTLASAVIPHPLDRVLAVPMGAALIWLGYVLWTEKERRAG